LNTAADTLSSDRSSPKPGKPKIAAILTARNEAGRIGGVLAVLRQVEALDEIIVIDDGSRDQTANEVRQATLLDKRIRLLQHVVNQGKGQAIFTGRHATQAPYLLLLDSDLVDLKPQQVCDLIQPVLDGKADMTVGLFRGGPWSTDLPHIVTPWLTGQRCIKSYLLDEIPLEAARGYGFETALTVAARNLRWRVRRVFLRGVSHPISEVHRGLLRGFMNRMKMYSQIARAWRITRSSRRRRNQRWMVRYRFPLIFILLMLISSGIYNNSVAKPRVNLDQIPLLSLSGSRRILVVAPHPDDESLGAGGVIQSALSQGKEVKVVIVTNGDGQLIGPLAFNQHPISSPADYVRIGIQRQSESLAALKILGLDLSNVYFLGYPDGGTNGLWFGDWQQNCPVLSPHTHATRSPYPNTYHPASQYCGKDLLDDLQSIIDSFRPDVIILPHPNDEHPDHRAVSNFTRLAVDLTSSQDPAYLPAEYGYLVHYGAFPQPRSRGQSIAILPPKALINANNPWVRLSLTPAQEQTKAAAVQSYHTQELVLKSFLLSFVRQDEIFTPLPALELASVAFTKAGLREEGVLATPTLQEPAQESTRRLILASADLIGWQALRIGDSVWFLAETRGRLLPVFSYRIYIKSPDGKTITVNCTPSDQHMGRNTFFTKISLSEMNNPSVLGFSAEVQKRFVILDRTAWHFVIMR
jgi:LmbE family N-acetylglucosaminyl deacetylase/glycosyltransferase involved in cell wall biosynthesis